MASTDDTGNASSGGSWKMEPDGLDIDKLYLDPKAKAKYRQTAWPDDMTQLSPFDDD